MNKTNFLELTQYEGEDFVDLVQQYNADMSKIDRHAQDTWEMAVIPYECTYNLFGFTLTTAQKIPEGPHFMRFKAPADFHDGDTFTVNGNPAEAVDLTGSPLSASYYLRDSWVLAAFYGGKLHFQGHNLTAQRNLLINGNFKINQLGQASYTPGRYTVDCWRFTGNGTKTLYVHNGYLEVDITTPGIWTNVFQTVEYLPAGTYTVSFQLSDYSKINYIYISGSINFWFSHFNSNVVTATFTATEEQKNISIGVQLKEEAGNNLKIYAAKLEEGFRFTGFTTPDPVLELTRCQRLMEHFSFRIRIRDAVNRSYAFPLPYRVTKRIKPTAANVKYGYLYNVTADSVKVSIIDEKSALIEATPTTAGDLDLLVTGLFDANL